MDVVRAAVARQNGRPRSTLIANALELALWRGYYAHALEKAGVVMLYREDSHARLLWLL